MFTMPKTRILMSIASTVHMGGSAAINRRNTIYCNRLSPYGRDATRLTNVNFSTISSATSPSPTGTSSGACTSPGLARCKYLPGSPLPLTRASQIVSCRLARKPRCLPSIKFSTSVWGKGQFESKKAGRTERSTAGSVILTFPGDRHRYRPNPAIGWDEMWIGFKGDAADRLVENGFLSAETPVFHTGYGMRRFAMRS